MKLHGVTVVVTGGGSGLGDATARRLAATGATVCVIDLLAADGDAPAHVAAYASADVTDEVALSDAFTAFGEAHGPIRGVVHCAGRGGDRVRILDKDGNAAPLDTFAEVIRVNLFGTYNVLRLGAKRSRGLSRSMGNAGRSCSPRRSRPSTAKSAKRPTRQAKPPFMASPWWPLAIWPVDSSESTRSHRASSTPRC